MKRLHLFLVLILFVFPVFAGAALAAERPVPAQSRSTVTKDAVKELSGDVADLRKALQEPAVVRYQLIFIDETQGEDKEAYLDRVLEKWGWPEPDTLLLVIYTKDNWDVRFAMGAAFRKANLSVADMVDLIHTAYVPEVRKGEPSRALAQLIRSVNARMNPTTAFTPEQVVKGYYWWHWGVFSPTDEQISQNTLAYRTYRTSPYVTAEYIKRTDELIDSFDKTGGGFDPVVCMQESPDKVTVGKADIHGDGATVMVQTLLGQNAARYIAVDLKQLDGKWLIDKITCQH